jgi:hypothetical protein
MDTAGLAWVDGSMFARSAEGIYVEPSREPEPVRAVVRKVPALDCSAGRAEGMLNQIAISNIDLLRKQKEETAPTDCQVWLRRRPLTRASPCR